MQNAKNKDLTPKVAVIGAGYWGKNLVRNFHQLGVLKTICDQSSAIRQQMAKESEVASRHCFTQNLNPNTQHFIQMSVPKVPHLTEKRGFKIA